MKFDGQLELPTNPQKSILLAYTFHWPAIGQYTVQTTTTIWMGSDINHCGEFTFTDTFVHAYTG